MSLFIIYLSFISRKTSNVVRVSKAVKTKSRRKNFTWSFAIFMLPNKAVKTKRIKNKWRENYIQTAFAEN